MSVYTATPDYGLATPLDFAGATTTPDYSLVTPLQLDALEADPLYDLLSPYGEGVAILFLNTVYDTDRSEWVTWATNGAYDDTGTSYPYSVGDWKADSYAHVGRFYTAE